MDSLEVITTGDGSHSLRNASLNETYHSIHGAIQESSHVFIANGLLAVAEKHLGKPIRILELGFGTGLNVLLTMIHAREKKIPIIYESWEKFPLAEHIVAQLNLGAKLGDPKGFAEIHRASWNVATQVNPSFVLSKKLGDILRDEVDGLFDLVYYDAFAPSKQPELWTLGALQKTTDRLDFRGTWVTYCAMGQMKRDLNALGLLVESLSGPPGKKEMTRASVQ